VGAGTPAARAGLLPVRLDERGRVVGGDVITAINGAPVTDFDDMLALLERHQSGDTVTLTLWRDGRTRHQALVLAATE
ncbi:MAG: PDZ domain-containing protein, partial [Burkholderiales bacterium]|nr:PDZ domain-containing protein [Burkholderiales bacterium]